ncbi:major facilitator superfamily domain-containing protein [Lentinula raphanica]|uniref:Major facilitator superfamily domain-containing protein n=1 Tax=Lentinula raphanica TaxID=153919 RepID=A0AA38PLM3_9AGAR|nr:major facilitator superfamily domain-containing protein [Lentinula raphanica]KAJ3970021.1 major facilitator superfamily domain-containing protein [Lentinula raphanica]
MVAAVVQTKFQTAPSVTALDENADNDQRTLNSEEDSDPELKLPKRSSLVIILLANALLQISFFIIVSSSNEYALHLGGTSTFSGVVIGIPTVFSGLTLIPLMKYDRGGYGLALNICCAASISGMVLYGSAYKANWLYLILLGRITSGMGFAMWMYCKRFCSDPRIVGIRRRTLLASWLMVGNGVGMGLGPLLGGIFYKYVGFGKGTGNVWNGFTSPAWVLAGVWAVYWVAVQIWFEDVPLIEDSNTENSPENIELVEKGPVQLMEDRSSEDPVNASGTSYRHHTHPSPPSPPSLSTVPPRSPTPSNVHNDRLELGQWASVICICWFAMASFFILGAWEANIPVYGSVNPHLNFTPFAAGNFLAIGALACFPFFIINVFLVRRVQDRYTLMFGASLGGAALVIFLVLLSLDKTASGGSNNWVSSQIGVGSAPAFFICWFAVALGFNIASTVTMSLLSKQLPATVRWNGMSSVMVQYSNYLGRVTGAVWGGAGVSVGMTRYVGLEIAITGIGVALASLVWKHLKAKTG